MKNLLSCCVCAGLFLSLILGCASSRSSQAPPTNGINVTAEDLISAYKANEVAADERYKNQPLAVTGTVDSIGKDILDTMYVTLKGDEKYGFTSVQCMFDDEHKTELAALSKGDHIRVVGICKGKLGNILLKECSIRP